MKKGIKVAAIGDNCIDYYQKLDRYYVTGNAVDFGVNMKLLGVPVSLISTTGDDEFGKETVKKLTEMGLDISHLKVVHGKTAVAYMDLVGLERTYLDYVEGVMENVTFSDDDITFAASHDLVHSALWGNADGHLKRIKELGARICFDYADDHENPIIARTVPYVDYAFFSFQEHDAATEAFLRDKTDKGVSIAVATFGEKGSLAFDGNKFYEGGIVPATVVNTIGAGDSFIAGFMYAILDEQPIEDALALGAKVSSGVVGVFGPWVE